MSKVLLYAGPTLHRATAIQKQLPLDGVTVMPPVRRGDLPRAVRGQPPGVLILVDGFFHTALAVGHIEIRDAIAAGFAVWGLSSMGAIRAREMQHMGVRGFGEVFALYCQEDVDFRDDEVTLLHEEGPHYRELSEPLCHIRVAVVALQDAQIISKPDGDALLQELSFMWYGERTMGLLAARLRALAPQHESAIEACLRDFDRYRIKAHDLIRFLEERPFARAAD